MSIRTFFAASLSISLAFAALAGDAQALGFGTDVPKIGQKSDLLYDHEPPSQKAICRGYGDAASQIMIRRQNGEEMLKVLNSMEESAPDVGQKNIEGLVRYAYGIQRGYTRSSQERAVEDFVNLAEAECMKSRAEP